MLSVEMQAFMFVVALIIIGALFLFGFFTSNSGQTTKKQERLPHDKKQLAKALDVGKIGQPLIFHEKRLSARQLQKDPYRENPKNRTYSVPCESRGIVFGVSGSGKTNYILAQIIDWMRSGKSFVVTDIKPEIWGVLHTNGLFEHFGYTDIVINPTDPQATPYNMLNDVVKDSDLDELLAILIPAASEELKGFANYGRLIFKAIIYHLQDTNQGEESVSLADAHAFLISTSDFNQLLYTLKKSTARVQKLVNQAQLSGNNERFVSSAVSALLNALDAFNNEVISNNQKNHGSLSKTLTQPRIAVFLQFEQSSQSLTENLYSATVQNLINSLMANHRDRDDVLLLLDELLNGGKIHNLPLKFNLMRSYKLPTFIYVQAMPNLRDRYGRGADELISACNVRICYRTNDQETAEYFSKESGESENTATTKSVQSDGKSTKTHISSQITKERLLSPHDMNNLKDGEALCVYNGKTAVIPMPIHYKDTLANKRAECVRPSEIL